MHNALKREISQMASTSYIQLYISGRSKLTLANECIYIKELVDFYEVCLELWHTVAR